MLISYEVFICHVYNLHIRVEHIKFFMKNTILKLRASWADICNNYFPKLNADLSLAGHLLGKFKPSKAT